MSDAYRRAAIVLAQIISICLGVTVAAFAYVGALVYFFGKWWAAGLTFGPLFAVLLFGAFLMIAEEEKSATADATTSEEKP